MKLSMTLGRKGEKYQTLYVGGDASAAVAVMAAEVEAEKKRFDEVLLYKAPLPFSRRRLTA